ncbi:MAG: ElyC/SanA/YdcF family protein, partial [Candidatus Pacebacteria bacterium]|nr:ElyC/SanA/YdcF family protein [Candidatus Paceibacterota bacterium]
LNKMIKYFLSLIFLILISINLTIIDFEKEIRDVNDLENVHTGLVLGASVKGNRVSDIFKDRLDAALILYNEGKIEKILISGDHGTKEYDEVNTAKDYLLSKNVLEEDIFLDHAGFDTYDSIYRAKEVFGISEVIIISQNFHLGRALYIAHSLGIDAQGFSADLHKYITEDKNNIREFLARIKAFFDVELKAKPKFLGDPINIYEDGRQTWD